MYNLILVLCWCCFGFGKGNYVTEILGCVGVRLLVGGEANAPYKHLRYGMSVEFG